jgi:cytochrome c peroxidase
VRNLAFAQDKKGHYNGSPYDRFLIKNNLPRRPRKGESLTHYNQRLLKAVRDLKQPRFVKHTDGSFKFHQQAFVFGPRELNGMKLFFARGTKQRSGGNCASCHAAPHFSDFRFHNTGLAQSNYDRLHGDGAFMKLAIPALSQRNRHYNHYLPATFQHPQASSRFRSVAAKHKPGYTDLGMWNVFANPDMPAPQAKLRKILCAQARKLGSRDCRNKALLALTIAAFKTPVLRDLGHSNPYMHTGQFDTIEQVLSFYLASSAQARSGLLRNAAPELRRMRIRPADVAPLAAFIRALNEDYE